MRQKVALYCRVSTGDQNCERQERDLLAYAEKCGYEAAGVFKETASGTRAGRAERERILALARQREIDVILVTELTRWGRSTVDLVHTLEQLQSWNVSLVAQTGLQFDLSTSHGRLIANMMSSLAQFERDLLSERVKSGLATARAKGRIGGRKKGHNVVADKIRNKVLKLRDEGLSIRKIAQATGASKGTVEKVLKQAY
jgi:putative DNA-invertase from lambdoid prophage Rac